MSASSPPPAKLLKMMSSSSSSSSNNRAPAAPGPTPFSALASPSSSLRSSTGGGSSGKISLGSSLKPVNGRKQLEQGGSSVSCGSGQGRKLVIRNERPRQGVASTSATASSSSSSSADFATAALQTLVRAVRAILSTPPEPTPESLQALYSLCEGIVSASSRAQGSGQVLAQTLYDRIRIEVERKVGESGGVLRGLDAGGEAWLTEVERTWQSFREKMLMVRSIFLHLDRTYVLQNAQLLSLWDLGLDIFRHRIVQDEQIGSRLTSEMLSLVNKERDGETISRSLLTMLISMLSTISSLSHNIIFATPYIASSKAYYDQEGHRLLGGPSSDSATVISTSEQQVLPIPAYLTHIKHRLAEEAERCDLVVGQSLKGDIIRAVEESLVQAHTATMIQRGLSNLLDEERMDDLSTIYSLFGRVRALLPLRTAFGEHVKTRGSAIIADTARDDAMVDRLIAFQSSVGGIISRAFASDADFVHASREAFKVAVNARQNKPAEMIAKYIDAKMRSGNKAMSDEELENTFRSVLTLFRYCQGKDIFEAFYKKDFAKRLLLNKSASSDAEKNMLLKLKEECGPGFTAKLETMAKDIDLSADIMKAYKEHLDASASPDSLLSVNILTSGNWPSYSRQPVRIPEDLQKELDRFGRFYKAKYAGRSLTFMHSLDQCTLKAEFKKGPGGGKKELNVSFHQAVVLLLFADSAPASGEEEAKIGFKDIVAQTGLEEKEAMRTLQSLACAKQKVLTKHPKGRDVAVTDEFSFNAGFTDDKFRLRINQIQQKETVEEARATTSQVLLDRQSHLQLVIVRILKSRKTVKHQELVMEVVRTLKERFRVDPPEIKKAVDSLIERDYMERAEGTRDTYNYLA